MHKTEMYVCREFHRIRCSRFPMKSAQKTSARVIDRHTDRQERRIEIEIRLISASLVFDT